MRDVHDRIREYWDRDAATYDRGNSGHALNDAGERAAYRDVLARHLPSPPARVLDVGAGTGAMSMIAAEVGHEVTALDISPEMLARAQEKAGEAGYRIEVVVATATEPPPGPFDAVIERHVLWTAPDPVAALRAWRDVAPGGRLLLFEGMWGGPGRAGEAAARLARRALRVPHEHHAPYPDDVLEELPLARQASLAPLLRAVGEAGWRRILVERIRGVERARRRASPPLLGLLEAVPRYAIVADA